MEGINNSTPPPGPVAPSGGSSRPAAAESSQSSPDSGSRVKASGGNTISSTNVALDVDKDTGRVIGRFVDKETGEVVDQYPSKEMIRLLAKTREMLGTLFDETA